MSTIIRFVYVFFICSISTFAISQINLQNLPPDGISPGELLIVNNTSYWRQYHHGPHAFKIRVKIIPVGFFYTAAAKYSPKGQIEVNQPYLNNITGGLFFT